LDNYVDGGPFLAIKSLKAFLAFCDLNTAELALRLKNQWRRSEEVEI
jgi:hypothetical protein